MMGSLKFGCLMCIWYQSLFIFFNRFCVSVGLRFGQQDATVVATLLGVKNVSTVSLITLGILLPNSNELNKMVTATSQLFRVTPAELLAVHQLLLLSSSMRLLLHLAPPHVLSSTLSGRPLASRLSLPLLTPIPLLPHQHLTASPIRYPSMTPRIRTSFRMLKILKSPTVQTL